MILPADITEKLSTGREQPTIEVLYNGEDAVKQRYVESIIRARMADANVALSQRFQQATAGYLELLLDGGTLSVLGRDVNILGLKNAHAITTGAIDALPPRSPLRTSLGQVAQFGQVAIDNLGLSRDVLRSVGEPLRVRQTIVGGKRTPLDTFAAAISVTVSLMFLTVLLAAGLLALEREEHAFSRLVRGLVSRLGLLVEKIGLAALCSFAVTLLMLLALGGFFIELDWARFPQWLLALARRRGRVRGARRRDRRPRARGARRLAARVPAVAADRVPRARAERRGLRRPLRRHTRRLGRFPFKATLQALDAALNDAEPDCSVRLRIWPRWRSPTPRSRDSRCGALAEDVEERERTRGRSATSASTRSATASSRSRSRCSCWGWRCRTWPTTTSRTRSRSSARRPSPTSSASP